MLEDSSKMEAFFDWYLKEGFSKSSKREIDIYALYYYSLQNPEVFKMDHYELSKMLKISQSKIRIYLNEIQLRFDQHKEKDILYELFNTILKGAFTISDENKSISILINNPIVHNYLKYQLNKLYLFHDYSFNSNIIKLSFENFEKVLESLINEIKDDDVLANDLKIFKKKLDKDILSKELLDLITLDIKDTILGLSKYLYKNKEKIQSVLKSNN